MGRAVGAATAVPDCIPHACTHPQALFSVLLCSIMLCRRSHRGKGQSTGRTGAGQACSLLVRPQRSSLRRPGLVAAASRRHCRRALHPQPLALGAVRLPVCIAAGLPAVAHGAASPAAAQAAFCRAASRVGAERRWGGAGWGGRQACCRRPWRCCRRCCGRCWGSAGSLRNLAGRCKAAQCLLSSSRNPSMAGSCEHACSVASAVPEGSAATTAALCPCNARLVSRKAALGLHSKTGGRARTATHAPAPPAAGSASQCSAL